MYTCYVGVGANLDNPQETLRQAIQELKCHPDLYDFACSPLYWTRPVSPIEQPNFLNGVCRFRTALSPLALLYQLQAIEQRFGKGIKHRLAPRKIDLDLLFYENWIYTSEECILPHPRWMGREFVLKPLSDLTKDFDVERKLDELPEESRCLLPLSPVLVS